MACLVKQLYTLNGYGLLKRRHDLGVALKFYAREYMLKPPLRNPGFATDTYLQVCNKKSDCPPIIITVLFVPFVFVFVISRTCMKTYLNIVDTELPK